MIVSSSLISDENVSNDKGQVPYMTQIMLVRLYATFTAQAWCDVGRSVGKSVTGVSRLRSVLVGMSRSSAAVRSERRLSAGDEEDLSWNIRLERVGHITIQSPLKSSLTLPPL